MAHQSYSTSAWERLPAAALPKSGGLFAYMRGLSLTAWLVSLAFGYLFVSDWATHQELLEGGFDIKKYFYLGFGAMVLAHLTLGMNAWIAVPFQMMSTWVGMLLTAFCFLMALLSPLSVIPLTSLVYAGATWFSAVMLWLYWSNNYTVLVRSLLVACWVQFAWWILLLYKHGLTFGFGGIIGNVNRNISGTAALAALICGLFTPNRYLRWAAFATCIFLATVVSSRGSLVALGVFIVVYYTLSQGFFRAATHFGLLGFLTAMVVLAVPQLRDAVVDKVFHLYDPNRGMGSGFTGRVEMWKQGIEWFWRKPIFGYGFRSTTETIGVGFGGVHSAHIKIFLEGGLFGGILVESAIILEAIRRMRVALRLRSASPLTLPGINLADSLRLNSIACGTLFLTLTMWVYDQYYINLGSPISVILFLMLMAPTYVTIDGRMIRR